MKFPLFVDISDKKVLVVGGGNIGCRRIKALLDFGANVTVVSPYIKDETLIPRVNFIKDEFKDSYTDGCFLVIASTSQRNVNKRTGEVCKAKNIPVSVADSAEESTFFFPALCVNSELCVGVVSNGDKHSLVRDTAAKIREVIL